MFSDYRPGNLVKEVIRKTGQIVLPDHTIDKNEESVLEELTPDITMFFEKTPS